jgi:hypothetical protein
MKVQALSPARGTHMTDTKALAADLLATMLNNVEQTKAAIKICDLQTNPGFVFVWPEYWLGVYVTNGKVRAVAIDAATITHRNDRRVFTNGKDEAAVLMPLREALEGALAHVTKVYEDLAGRIKDTTPSSKYVASPYSFDRD